MKAKKNRFAKIAEIKNTAEEKISLNDICQGMSLKLKTYQKYNVFIEKLIKE